MRKSETRRPPLVQSRTTGEPTKEGRVGSRNHVRQEAVRKDQRSVDEVMKPGPPPDPGLGGLRQAERRNPVPGAR